MSNSGLQSDLIYSWKEGRQNFTSTEHLDTSLYVSLKPILSLSLLHVFHRMQRQIRFSQ